MVFSDSTTQIGLIQEVDRICGTSDNNYTLKAKTARINAALDRYMYLALISDETWQFDDLNKTDLPIGTANLVSGQQDYEFADEVLVVQKVLAKGSGGLWKQLAPVFMDSPEADNIWLLPTANTGDPVRYQKFAHSVLLDPIPNYASTSGLKIVFKRNLVKFVSTDTTAVPGISTVFHTYLARFAALQFCIEKGLKQTQGVMSMVQQDEQAIKDFFNVRSKDIDSKLYPYVEDTK